MREHEALFEAIETAWVTWIMATATMVSGDDCDDGGGGGCGSDDSGDDVGGDDGELWRLFIELVRFVRFIRFVRFVSSVDEDKKLMSSGRPCIEMSAGGGVLCCAHRD